jgi:hypothetical protein
MRLAAHASRSTSCDEPKQVRKFIKECKEILAQALRMKILKENDRAPGFGESAVPRSGDQGEFSRGPDR